MISMIQIILSNYQFFFINSKFSNITLKINRTWTNYVLSPHGNFQRKYYPDIIYINGENQSIIKNNYDFNKTDNLVQLV